MEITSIRPSVCDQVSATKSYVEFPWHSIKAFYTESCPASVRTVKISLVSHLNEIRTRSLQIYFPIWVQIDIRDLHVMLLNICEFHENRRQEAQMKLRLRVRRGSPQHDCAEARIAQPAVSPTRDVRSSLPHCEQCPDVPRPTSCALTVPSGDVRHTAYCQPVGKS